MKYLLTLFSICSLGLARTQNINWASTDKPQNNLLYVNFGYDYGVTTQLGYGRKLNTFKSMVVTADYSFPMGNSLMDDFKIRIGGQMPIYGFKNFQFSVKLNGVYRRHQTVLVSMNSIGSEIALLFGIYKPKWHLAAEGGYDNAGATHLNHSDKMKVIYPSIKDGWYSSTGGNFFYGIQGSKTIDEKIGLSLRLGATTARLKDQNPLIPIYLQLGAIYSL